MKSSQEILDHVAAATGTDPETAGRVIDAAFAFLRDSALAGEDVAHPNLGRIRVRARDDGKTAFRYLPKGGAGKGEGGKRGAGKGAGGRGKGAGKGAGRGKGAGAGARRRRAAGPEGGGDPAT